jgi:hypothetical protein
MNIIKRQIARILLMSDPPPGIDWSEGYPNITRSGSPPLSRSSPAPDTTSPIYPDRLIRPLPKRRLRDRLSLQQTEEIVFPSVPSKETRLFSFHLPDVSTSQQAKDEVTNRYDAEEARNTHAQGGQRREMGNARQTERVNPTKSSPRQGNQRQRSQGSRNNLGKSMMPSAGDILLVDSANSSVDGDEGFENTNNKKKRKIPQSQHTVYTAAGNVSLTTVSADMANLGLSSKESDTVAGAERINSGQRPPNNTNYTPDQSPVNAATGNAGRARYGRLSRPSYERRPLAASTNALNLTGSARARLSPSSKGELYIISISYPMCAYMPLNNSGMYWAFCSCMGS